MTSPTPRDRIETLMVHLGSTGRLIIDATQKVTDAVDDDGAVTDPAAVRRAQEILTEAQMALGRSRATLAGISRGGGS